MIHIRTNPEETNDKARYACGLGPKLPEGDKAIYEAEYRLYHMVDCRACLPTPVELGTPISQLSGRPGFPGYEKFKAIAASYGYD